jgi:hypothetical protein
LVGDRLLELSENINRKFSLPSRPQALDPGAEPLDVPPRLIRHMRSDEWSLRTVQISHDHPESSSR